MRPDSKKFSGISHPQEARSSTSKKCRTVKLVRLPSGPRCPGERVVGAAAIRRRQGVTDQVGPAILALAEVRPL
jgi:hypothetical protein